MAYESVHSLARGHMITMWVQDLEIQALPEVQNGSVEELTN